MLLHPSVGPATDGDGDGIADSGGHGGCGNDDGNGNSSGNSSGNGNGNGNGNGAGNSDGDGDVRGSSSTSFMHGLDDTHDGLTAPRDDVSTSRDGGSTSRYEVSGSDNNGLSVSCNSLCATPTDMSTSPSSDVGIDDMNRTASNMSISSDTCSTQGDTASVSSDDGSTTSTLCTTPTTERDEVDDWESIIDDAVSSLTAGRTESTPASDDVRQHNPKALLHNSSCSIRVSIDSSSSEWRLDSSGDFEGGVHTGPCIFDDYCPKNTNSQRHNNNPLAVASVLFPDDFGGILGDGLVASEYSEGSATEELLMEFPNNQSADHANLLEAGGDGAAPCDPLPARQDECEDGGGHEDECAGNCDASDSRNVMFVIDGKPKLKAADLNRIVQRLTWYTLYFFSSLPLYPSPSSFSSLLLLLHPLLSLLLPGSHDIFSDKHNDPEFTAACLLTYR